MKLTNFSCIIGIMLNLAVQAQSFDTYMNPVIPGDHPDATLTRVGNDFYTTGSSFNVTPVIYHSTDLVHWEAIAQPVKASWSNYGDSPGGGCWGGQVVYYNGKYWHYFSRGGSTNMYFTTANDVEGPWSEPTHVNNPPELPYGLGYDNSVFIDDDGKWYLVVKNGQPNGGIVELGNDGQPTGVVYDLNWLNPEPDFPYSWAEGPVIWKFKGYYYYSFARDLAGGQKVMRSDTLTANENDWEMLGDFFNESDPLISGSLFTSPNHASPVVMIDDSTHWVIHPLYAKGEWRGQGRQGLLNQVHYDANLKPTADYPINTYFTAPDLPSSGIPWMVPKSDFFTSPDLNPEWSLLGYTPDDTWSLTDRPGWLRLSPKSSTNMNTVIKNDGEHNYSLITRLEFDPQTTDDQAGLWIMRGDETSFLKLYSSVNKYNRKVIFFNFDNDTSEIDNTIGNTLWLKIMRVNHIISGYISKNGSDWEKVGDDHDISSIDSYSDFVTFTGTRQGPFVQGSEAYFDQYIYRDAYSPVLAECPANQFGTVPTSQADGINQLDSIHNNDWALYAGVEFGNDNYLKAPKSIEIIASSNSSGGTVEVWLDSIGTGTKIADCEIQNTGGWDNFETFSVPVSPFEGRHDLYLHFTGAGGEKLFILKWIEFTAEAGSELINAEINDDDTLSVKLSQPLLTPALPSGLSIEANGSTDIPITDISLANGDSTVLIVTLASVVTNTDEITISYDTGTITNTAGIGLMPFNGITVDNRLPGAVPVVKLIETKHEGDTVWLYLSKEMNSPSAYSADFTIEIEGKDDITISSAELSADDSAIIILLPAGRLYYEDNVSLTFSGTTLESANGGLLASFTSGPVQNHADGYPPEIVSAKIRKQGVNYRYIDLSFDKPLRNADEEKDFFTITLNDIPVEISTLATDYDSVSFAFSPYIQYGDEIKISYSGGNVRTRYNGKLQDFSDYVVTNTVPEPEPSGISSVNSNDAKIKIFPNPAKSEVNVIWESTFDQLTIYSLEGKMLLNISYNAPVKSVNISPELDPGIYLMKLSNRSTSSTVKFFFK